MDGRVSQIKIITSLLKFELYWVFNKLISAHVVGSSGMNSTPSYRDRILVRYLLWLKLFCGAVLAT